MAIKTILDGSVRSTQGTSSDIPALAADGSTHHNVETGEQWVFHDGDWFPDRRLELALKRAFTIK